MNLMDTKYNLRRQERNDDLPGLGYPKWQIEPGSECGEGDGWNVIVTVSGKGLLISVV